tara:strand:- start:9012 stop:9578 length:567 start_codon:yes stop_codon:yes gene_type:complete
MHRKVLTTFLFSILLSSNGIAASSKWYETKQVNFEITIPTKTTKNWLVAPILGFPLAVLAPSEKGYRPTMSLTPEMTPSLEPITFDEVRLQEPFYKAGREKFVKDRQGKVKEFFKPTKVDNKNNLEIYSLGYRYELANMTIVERSIRFMCDGYLVLGMTRYYPDLHKSAEKDFSKILKNINCKKAGNI